MSLSVFAAQIAPSPRPEAGYRERLRWFYGQWSHDLAKNSILAVPVVVLLLFWVLLSASLLWWLDGNVDSLRAGLFASMQSVFGDNFGASSFAGRTIYIFNALVGLLFLGFVVWLFTLSAERAPVIAAPEYGARGISDLIEAVAHQRSNNDRERFPRAAGRPRVGKRRSLLGVRHVHRLN